MSRISIWLILVFDDSLEEAWFTNSLFDEEHANSELADLHVNTVPRKRERHLRYKLERPLTLEQLHGLSRLKEQELFSNF
jgi:hypothetical protein